MPTSPAPEPQRRGRAALAAITAVLGAAASAAWPQAARLPADAVDAFHAALKKKDTAGALSHLDRGLVVFEFGGVDATAEAYAQQHLLADIDMAAATAWTLQTRRVGGEGAQRWILSTYRVTGIQSDGKPIDQQTLETAIVQRVGEQFRIVHLHWSTSDAAFQAWAQAQRNRPAK